MDYKYGTFTGEQVLAHARLMHNEIHKLLLYKDPQVTESIFCSDDEFETYFTNLLSRYGGMNELLGAPKQMISLMSTLEAAHIESTSESFNYHKFRKLILDAHGYLTAIFEEVK